MTNKVVTFGEIMIRLGAPDHLLMEQSHQLDVSFAGAEANVAYSLVNYGVEAEYVTCLPHHPLADRCLKELRGNGVCLSHVKRQGERMGVLYLEPGSNARPSKIWYDRANSSFAAMPENCFDWEEILDGADWFHWTGITPALSENAAKECLKAIQTANELGITVSCDINYRGNLWKYGKTASEVMPELVAGSDVILGNEEDCEKVFGIKPKDFDANKTEGVIDQTAFISVCQQMMERFPRCKKMAVTLRGSVNADHNTWGGVLYDGSQLLQSRRYDITDIVDRVGGGDSFMGGLIYGLLHYQDDKKALEFATAASCLKHAIKGDYNMMTVKDVEALMGGDASGRVKR